MKTIQTTCLILTATILASGCATKHKYVVFKPAPIQPVVQVIPPQGRPEARVAQVPVQPIPIYQAPIIEEVEAAPYVDETGNLVFPQKVMVIREPGHWNLEAAKLNAKYYIPSANQPPQLTPPSKGYYDYIQEKQAGVVPTANIDVSKVIVTGYLQKSEEADARATLKTGQTLTYDPYLGWLAVPSALLQKGGDITPAPQAEIQATPAPAATTPAAPVAAAVQNAAPATGAPSTDASRQDEVKKLIQDAFNQK